MSKALTGVSLLQKGKGKALLFLHGYLSNKESFSAQIAYFSRFYRVIAIDFLGFGQSQPLTKPFSVGDYAEWLFQILQELGVEKPHVVAHSFGCRVAVKVAGKYPSAFDKIVLTGPAGIIVNRGFKYKCKVRLYRLVRRFFPRFAERRFGSAEYRSLSPIMKESYKKIVNEDLRACAKRIENEVLLVEGTEDTVTPMREAEAYLACLQKGRLKTLAGGHFAFAENPVLFNLIAEEFFYE